MASEQNFRFSHPKITNQLEPFQLVDLDPDQPNSEDQPSAAQRRSVWPPTKGSPPFTPIDEERTFSEGAKADVMISGLFFTNLQFMIFANEVSGIFWHRQNHRSISSFVLAQAIFPSSVLSQMSFQTYHKPPIKQMQNAKRIIQAHHPLAPPSLDPSCHVP